MTGGAWLRLSPAGLDIGGVDLTDGGRRERVRVERRERDLGALAELLVEHLDASGQVIDRTIDWVPGDVTPGTRHDFEVPLRGAAPGYRVVVLSWYPGSLKNVFPGREFHHNRVQLICSQTGGIAPEFSNRWSLARATAVVFERIPELQLAPLISHEVDVADAAEAYRMIDEGREDVMQVVLKYQ